MRWICNAWCTWYDMLSSVITICSNTNTCSSPQGGKATEKAAVIELFIKTVFYRKDRYQSDIEIWLGYRNMQQQKNTLCSRAGWVTAQELKRKESMLKNIKQLLLGSSREKLATSLDLQRGVWIGIYFFYYPLKNLSL